MWRKQLLGPALLWPGTLRAGHTPGPTASQPAGHEFEVGTIGSHFGVSLLEPPGQRASAPPRLSSAVHSTGVNFRKSKKNPHVNAKCTGVQSADPRSVCQISFGGEVYLSPTPLRLEVRSIRSPNTRENSSKMMKLAFYSP